MKERVKQAYGRSIQIKTTGYVCILVWQVMLLASFRSECCWKCGLVEAVGPIEPMAKKIERMVDDKRRGLQRVQSQKRKADGRGQRLSRNRT